MEGMTDAPMRAMQGELCAFTFAVSEFLRITTDVPSQKAICRHVPELLTGGATISGLPVQVQLLGGDTGRMAESAAAVCAAGAKGIDVNFGCPAPTVNRHDGGATLLKNPSRVRDVVAAIRAAVPPDIPVSAKLRLGWDTEETVFETAAMAQEGGASWLTIHGRTRMQGYRPPANWKLIGAVREQAAIPVVANGDIWTIEEFRRCRDVTGCMHFMLGRGAMVNPRLARQAAFDLGLSAQGAASDPLQTCDWLPGLRRLAYYMERFGSKAANYGVRRLKQWLRLASIHGTFTEFEIIKQAESVDELIAILASR
jgi:tRNA-dihydrouridine synthase C